MAVSLGLTALLAVACSSQPEATTESAPRALQYSGVLAATDFVVGKNRFPFGLITVDGTELRKAAVQVEFYSLAQEEPQLKATGTAQWREVTGVNPHAHTDGQLHQHLDVRGLYVVDDVTFDGPGFWGAEFIVEGGDGLQRVQGLAFEVNSESPAPMVGSPVPPTQNPTIRDVPRFSDISTRLVEDRMHDYSVAGALELRKPFVVLFSSPSFCLSRMCGPVTDMAAAVHERYQDRVAFIHIEPYDLKLARNEGRLVPNDAMQQWRLPTEPWLFVVGADGKVAARFEGLVSTEELEKALQGVLASRNP
jgi:hypothetical protein